MKIKIFITMCSLAFILGCNDNKQGNSSNIVLNKETSIKTKTKSNTSKNNKRTEGYSIIEGRHKLSLQWISWEYFGYIDFKRIGDKVYKVDGSQDGNKSNGECDNCYLKINGEISQISENVLSFTGKIESSVYHIQNGTPCIKEGTFEFKSVGGRKYWRCQNMNGCDGATDYVDIYFE